MEPWVVEIQNRAASGKPIIRGGRSERAGFGFEKLLFVPAQFARFPKDYFRQKISCETVIGKLAKKPLKLAIPILLGAISYGAVSKEAKIALAKASALAGTAANTGEGGMLPEERKAAKLLIIQYSTSRFGITEDVLRQADGIEIKLGQGAKPGQGGLLPAAKVTPEIAKIRKVPMGQDIHSPPSHPDIKNWQDLRDKIKWLRQFTDGPIIVKIAAGDLEHDIPLIVKANPDVIAIDGMGGGSGAAPVSIMENFGMPTLIGLVRARAILDKLRAKQQLIIGGGLNTGADVAKALALGADAVFMAMAPLIAMGCIYCKLCYLGKCPVGIATQDPVLRKKLDPKAEQKVANFLNSITEEVKMIAAACGYDDVHKLNRNDLRCLDSEISKLTGIKTI